VILILYLTSSPFVLSHMFLVVIS